MALIFFSALVDEILGKLAGSVFQYSQGGYQVHTLGKPRNPQTEYQQLRRGDFGFLSASWRSLTPTQRNSFISNVPAGISALNFFVQCNVNLILIGEPTIQTFAAATPPGDMAMQINSATPEEFLISASGATTIVPAGQKLLIYSTDTKDQTKIFTNPSQYSPIISFDEGTDLSTPTSILAAFNDRFGQLTAEKYLCIKSVLIDKSNGQRGTESISCSNTNEVANKYFNIAHIENDVSNVGAFPTALWYPDIPAHTLVNNGDKLIFRLTGYYTAPTGGQLTVGLSGAEAILTATNNAQNFFVEGFIQKVSSTDFLMGITQQGTVDGVMDVIYFGASGYNFNAPIAFNVYGQGSASGQVTLSGAYIDVVQL